MPSQKDGGTACHSCRVFVVAIRNSGELGACRGSVCSSGLPASAFFCPAQLCSEMPEQGQGTGAALHRAAAHSLGLLDAGFKKEREKKEKKKPQYFICFLVDR